jgi:type I restriction enzyme R subunit
LRTQIDASLAAAGWIVQPRDQMDLGAGLGVAVREFSTASGPVDYALFVGSNLCGVIAAKPADTALSGFAEQAARDIADVPGRSVRREGQARFEYVASSSELLFRDHADPAPRARRVFFFHRPETLQRWLADDATIRHRLQAMPPLVTAGLRDCQAGAVRALEASLAAGKPRAFIQMAAGAGKTFTACTFSHRLLAHGKFRRVLFLADRASLVRQARDEFLAYCPPATGGSFTEPLDIQKLGPDGIDDSAAVVISTIGRVHAVLTATELSEEDEERSGFEARPDDAERVILYNPQVPIETFDLVIIDECHHAVDGAWRAVLDYFDAFTVALTATPSRHALGFFDNNLVAQYPCERAVADGVSAGYEVYRIRAEAGEDGGKVSKGYALPVRDRRTRAQRYEELNEDLADAANDVDRTVAAPSQIRTVLEAFRDSLFTELFPGRTEVPKTLIFAKDDDHAEAIVDIACEVFDAGRDFARHIACRADGADPDALLRRFRSDYNPRIAVTVDMIATGADVRPLEALIFLRDVKSALYFEQMKGRGACTITPTALQQVTPDAQAKTRFVVIDAVGVAESLKQVTAPLERARAIGFDHLVDDIAAGRRDDDALSSLASRLAVLDCRIDAAMRATIVAKIGGLDPKALANRLIDAVDPDAVEQQIGVRCGVAADDTQREAVRNTLKDATCEIFGDSALRQLLKDGKRLTETRIDTVSTDVVSCGGHDEKSARNAVDKFEAFLDVNRDRLVALQILHGRSRAGQKLDRAAIEAVREVLRRPPWLLEPVDVWRAYVRLDEDRVKGNPAGTLSDIVMLVRYGIGASSSLKPLSAIVVSRFNFWLVQEERAGRVYTEAQKAWLRAVRDYIADNVAIAPRDLTEAREFATFAAQGGLSRARALFGARLEPLLEELPQFLVA